MDDVLETATDLPVIMAVAAGLILIGIVASKISSRFGIPALLLFLGIGMLAGSDGIGGIDFSDQHLAQSVGVVALAFILFAGGLDTSWSDVRPIVGHAALLATLGVLVTATITGLAAVWILGVPWEVGLLLGAIVSSTDAAAVFSVLRSRSVGLTGSLRPLLELESGSNDPMAVFLTLAFLALVVDPGRSLLEAIPVFFLQMTVGAIVGFLFARLAGPVIRRLRLEYEGLYPVLLIAIVLATYGVAALLHGSGFLAVYIAGIVMGNTRFPHKRSLMRFGDGLAWLMQISMFLMLGLFVFPTALGSVAFEALALSVVLILIARPVATLAVLLPLRYGPRPSMMVSWVGLRGAVPIILATFPLVERIPYAELIFNVVFFIVLTSVLVQGTTIPVVARWLGVDTALNERPGPPLEFVGSAQDSMDLHEIEVTPDAPAVGRLIAELGLPVGVLVTLITRRGVHTVPRGASAIEAGDVLMVLAGLEDLGHTREILRGSDG